MIEQSLAIIREMQTYWQENDPDYAIVLLYLKTQLPEIANNYPPALWPQILDMNRRLLKTAIMYGVELNKQPGETLH